MGYKKLTKQGINFISSKANGTSLISGKNKYALPYSNHDGNTIFNATITYNNKPISNDVEYLKMLIQLFDKYAKIYKLDANIIAAQAFAESEFKCWNYSTTGAIGITQFIPATIYDVIIVNNFKPANFQKFTSDEKNKIIINIPDSDDYLSIKKGGQNRSTLHQNVMNNPEIMIKAQCSLMSYIGQKNNQLAASSLFAYNRGAAITSNSYAEAIKKSKNPIAEGINYVNVIFKLLKESFGYVDLKVDATSYALSDGTLLDPNRPPKILKVSETQEAEISKLHIELQDKFRRLIYEIELQTGYKVLITSGYRTVEQQKGLSADDDRNAEAGRSFHNYGLALDINLVSDNIKLMKTQVIINGSPITDLNVVKQYWIDSGAVEIAKLLQFKWGGDFKNYFDPVHFELSKGYSIDRLFANASKQLTNTNTFSGNQVSLT